MWIKATVLIKVNKDPDKETETEVMNRVMENCGYNFHYESEYDNDAEIVETEISDWELEK